MSQFESIKAWYKILETRERYFVILMLIIVPITLFYVVIWEPIQDGLDKQQKLYSQQQEDLNWMQSAANEVQSLKKAGARPGAQNTNQPLSIIIDQSATNSGLKKNLSKLELSGTTAAQAKLELVSFDQMLLWLNTLQKNYGVNVSSARIERTDTEGAVNAQLTFKK